MLYTVFGGQFGSEGKGQVAAHIAQGNKVDFAVRIGGPNAGHTFYVEGEKHVVQTVPTCGFFGSDCFIGPEGAIIISLMKEELWDAYKVLGRPVKMYLDPKAAVITENHMSSESALRGRIGSTGEGVGSATSDKVWRKPELVVEHRSNMEEVERAFRGPGFDVTVCDTVEMTNKLLLRGATGLIEGTQGYGLSLHTSGFYPYCTSRECTPQALWAGTGINPRNSEKSETVMVMRTFPIRVGGNSGPLFGELPWEGLSAITGGYIEPEITTVTKKVRRIGKLDIPLLERAILQCRPDCLAVTFLDYVFPQLAGKTDISMAYPWLSELSNTLGVPVKYASTGPGVTIEL